MKKKKKGKKEKKKKEINKMNENNIYILICICNKMINVTIIILF